MNRKVTRLTTPVVALLAALALASCTGGGAGEAPADERQSSFVQITDQQGSVEGFVGASDDAELDRCEAANDGWLAEGTVTNPTEVAQAYRIYVAFNKNRDTQGLVQVDLESVAAGESASWKAEAPISGQKLQCILRVERFAPQG